MSSPQPSQSPPEGGSEPAVGAHLATPRRGFVHHGLYAGGGQVIHYAGLDHRLRAGPVEQVSLERFARGRGYVVVPRAAPRHAGAAAVERARSRLGERRYSLRSNNCEHFVHWCLDGVARSPQVEAIAERLRRPIVALAGWLGVAGSGAAGRGRATATTLR